MGVDAIFLLCLLCHDLTLGEKLPPQERTLSVQIREKVKMEDQKEEIERKQLEKRKQKEEERRKVCLCVFLVM